MVPGDGLQEGGDVVDMPGGLAAFAVEKNAERRPGVIGLDENGQAGDVLDRAAAANQGGGGREDVLPAGPEREGPGGPAVVLAEDVGLGTTRKVLLHIGL